MPTTPKNHGAAHPAGWQSGCVTTDDDGRTVDAAVRNNAEWCDVVCRTHGLTGEFRSASWTSGVRTPALYPDAITLSAAATVADVLPWIDTTPGCSVKDSYGVLDLAPYGFEVLFDAWWIRRTAAQEGPTQAADVTWSTLRSADALAAWQDAWSGGDDPRPFLPELLAASSVRVVGGYRGDQVVAGAVLNRAATVVGVSNVFAVDGDLGTAWAGALGSAAQHFPKLTVVGYESGPGLKVAAQNGFDPLGPLRIWLRS